MLLFPDSPSTYLLIYPYLHGIIIIILITNDLHYCKLISISTRYSSPQVLSKQTKKGAILGLKKCTAMGRMLQYGMISDGDNILKIPYVPYS